MSDSDFESSDKGGGGDSDFSEAEEASPRKKKAAASSKKEKASPSKKRKKGDEESKAGPPEKKSTKAKGTPAPAAAPAASSGKAAAKPNIKGNDANEVALNYMIEQNRPYSYLQVFENLHGVIRKTDVPKILDQFVTEGKLVEFTFGKTKLYMADQKNCVAPNNAESDALEAQLSSRTSEVTAIRQEIQSINADAASLETQPTNAEADEVLANLAAEIEQKTKKLQMLSTSVTLVSAEDMNKMKEKLKHAYRQWRVRRSAVMEMAESALGESSKTVRNFLEEVGCETDEDVGVKMDSVSHLLPK